MKIRAVLLTGLLALVGGLASGCCWDGPFCEIPKCDPCAPKPCDCPPPCPPPPCAPPAAK